LCRWSEADEGLAMTDSGAASRGDRWLDAFEQAVRERLPVHFGDQPDWGFQLDRAGPTLSVGNQKGAPSVTTALPPAYLERNAWLLADLLLKRLRLMAEKDGFLRQQALS
jgi:hypothetical protein